MTTETNTDRVVAVASLVAAAGVFTCPTWYKVTHGPAGHRVLLSDGPEGPWEDFHGYLNDAWLPRVLGRVIAQGAKPSGVFSVPACCTKCGHNDWWAPEHGQYRVCNVCRTTHFEARS